MEKEMTGIEELDPKDLLFGDWLTLAWAFAWRGMIIMLLGGLCGALIGGILGFIVGIICAVSHYPFDNIKLPFQIFCGAIGLGVGVLFVILQLKWIFNTKFAKFRVGIIKIGN